MLGLRGMAGAAGNLELASHHLKGSFLIFQVFHDDSKVLCHRPHLVVEVLLQFPFSFFRRGGSPALLRPNDPILSTILGDISHYHILPFGIWNNLIVDGVWDLEGLLMMFQGSTHEGSKIRLDVGS